MKRWLENPLLYYQLYGAMRNRWKRQPFLYGTAAVSIALIYLLLLQLVSFTEAGFVSTLTLCLFAMCLSAPLMAYNLFSLEYEKQTWETLALTRLTAKEILWGKWGTALMRVAGFTLLVLPLLLLGIGTDISNDLATKLYRFGAGVWMLFGWGALIVSLGMWLSFKLRRTLTTASALYAGQVFALILLPLLLLIFSGGDAPIGFISGIQSYREGIYWWIASFLSAWALLFLNPFWAVYQLSFVGFGSDFLFLRGESYSAGLRYMGWGFVQGGIYLALALLFAGLTYRGLKYAWRK
ncbi:MAG: hypothetical protein CFK49_01730 [Armatimonadetes bacterium JP3_11]|jgi:ABC-type transport system involved in multi-copper enzyme maturation permease subunit|nr:MAG: hypothetical protein CFK48_02515 [Armatimonadetes bacterium CP1_7O]OYT75745.1 MAG: hypothetical protein CFK49_01730 [Armatimonadetes bacterium JP3_11]RMH10851.1 MAG: hypothetical protein D6697_00015 [Armatimonadota bacterium]